MPRTSLLLIATLCLGTLAPTLPAFAQRTDALINEQLDRPIELDVQDQPLPEVLKLIEGKTGIPVRAEDGVYDLLPYGRQTPISVTVRNVSLRAALDAIGRKLGIEHVLRDEALELRPMPALARLGRRSTVQELSLLDLLAGVPLNMVEERPTVQELLTTIDEKLAALDSAARDAGRSEPGFQLEVRLDEALREQPVYVGRNATLDEALEEIHIQTKATWYPWGDSVVVVPKREHVGRLLEQPITLSYDRADIQQVLLELSQASGVDFQMEPGVLQAVPEEFRRVRLFLENASVREALESLSGLTGVGYVVTEEGVYLWNTNTAKSTGPRAERIVLMIPTADGVGQIPVYESELPPEILKRVRLRKSQALEQLGETPTTQPANQS